jgi:DNA-binding HxlR family transcriptional regulator
VLEVTELPAGQRNAIGVALGLLGDEWSLLILREALLGATRFVDWRARLPISNAVLTARLARLVDAGLFVRGNGYRLTERGADVWSVLLAIWAWEDRWVASHVERLPVRVHRLCGRPFDPVLVCSACDRPVSATDRSLEGGFGPSGSWERSVPEATTRRRSADPSGAPETPAGSPSAAPSPPAPAGSRSPVSACDALSLAGSEGSASRPPASTRGGLSAAAGSCWPASARGALSSSGPAGSTSRSPSSARDALSSPVPASRPSSAGSEAGLFPETAALIGNRWSAALVGAAFLGVHRFVDFQRCLNTSPTLVADRIRTLRSLDVLADDYRLTAKGLAFFPVVMCLVGWAQRWYRAVEGPALSYRHLPCGGDFVAALDCSSCGERLVRKDVAATS